jgi:type II secretory pathway component GspD/PulD (secretin)
MRLGSRIIDCRSAVLAVLLALALSTTCGQAQEPAVKVDIPSDVAIVSGQPENAPSNSEIRVEAKRLKDYNLPGLSHQITSFVNLQPLEVSQIIEMFASEAGLSNIVMSQGVKGILTRLKLSNVTVADALEVVMSINNLAYEVKGGILKIMTDTEYRALYGASFYEHRKVKIAELKYADPARVAAMLDKLKSEIGVVAADQVTGTIILIDTPDRIREMQMVIEKADIATVSRQVPTETKSFVLQYGNIDDIQKEISAALTKENGSIRSDKRTKTLVVTDLPYNVARIQQLVSLFDKKPRQVFIEAKVVEVSLSDDYSLGINWQHMFQGMDPRFAFQAISQPGSSAKPAGMFSYNTIVAGGDLSIVLDALKKVGKTHILSNPNIAVMDGQEASIEVIEDQPYKEVQLESGTTNITGVTYLFKKVGVQMSITPRINDEKFISVSIKPEISSISTWYDGAPQVGTPVIKKSLAQTMVMVKDGVTIIIGGMISERKDTSSSSVPVLGSIPLLGRLFRYDSDSSASTETVVFMTPRIVGGDEPFLLMRDMKKQPKPMRQVGELEDKDKVLRPVR